MDNLDITLNNQSAPKPGCVLLSEPFLTDQYFNRSVVFLCDFSKEEGTFGFVLNNYLELEIHEVVKNFPEFETTISIGGPIKKKNLYYLHTLGEQIEGAEEIIPGVYMGGSFEILKEAIEKGNVKNNEVRFFLGYSGWSPGQLEEELKDNSWMVSSIKIDEIMNSKRQGLWKDTLSKLGSKYKMISEFPSDPSLN